MSVGDDAGIASISSQCCRSEKMFTAVYLHHILLRLPREFLVGPGDGMVGVIEQVAQAERVAQVPEQLAQLSKLL